MILRKFLLFSDKLNDVLAAFKLLLDIDFVVDHFRDKGIIVIADHFDGIEVISLITCKQHVSGSPFPDPALDGIGFPADD